MRALTLTQPWATLVAIGAKSIETRVWATKYRGPIAIHAAKGWSAADRRFADGIGEESSASRRARDLIRATMAGADGHVMPSAVLPRGAILAIAELVECRAIRRNHGGQVTLHDPTRRSAIDPTLGDFRNPLLELSFGDYTEGRVAWMLEEVAPLPEPIPAKGMLGLWEWEAAGPGDEIALGSKPLESRRVDGIWQMTLWGKPSTPNARPWL